MAVRHRPLLTAIALAAFAAPSVAADPPAGQNVALPYPTKVPVVVQVQGHERAKTRLLKTLDALPPAEAKQAKKAVEDGFKQLLEGRKLTAVPGDGRLFLVLHDVTTLGDDAPALSVLLPVTSYADFKASFLTADEGKTVEKAGDGVEAVKFSAGGDETTLYMAAVKGYVAVSPNKETAELYAGKYTPAQSGSMGAELSASFLAGDVSVFVDMDVINDLYGDKIRQFKELIDFALGQAAQGGMIPGLNKQQLEMTKTVLQGVVQAVEDGKGVVIAAELRPEGANVRVQGRFSDESASALMLKQEVPGPLTDLAKLPKGLAAYSGAKFGGKFAGLWGQITREFSAPDDDEAAAKRIEELQAAVTAAGPGTTYSASAAPDRGLTLTGYKAPDKAATALAKLYDALPAGGRVSTVILKDKPKVAFDAQKHRGFTFAEVRLNFDFEATVEGFPEPVRDATLEQLKKMAAAKTTFWLGSDGKVVAHLTAKAGAAATGLLAQYLAGGAGVGGDAGFQLTRKNLPADATAVYITETAETIEALAEQAKTAAAAMPGGGGLPEFGKLKKPDGAPTFIGIALTLKGQVAAADLFVPAGALTVGGKMLSPLLRNVE
ncbi:MAG: hypothetical protein K2X82_28230 [Gemmataceae bacterium]|nr:hypothetical protein [Gemmataceae bacterium]